MQDTILQSIGWTPLVRLRRVTEGTPAEVYVKVESQNPGGSVKDRVGLAMVSRGRATRLAAARRHHHRGHRRQHRRRPGHGRRRQGLSLHLRSARQDVRREDRPAQGLRGRGRHHRRPTSPPDSPDSYNGVADRLAREIPGAWRPNQFANLANPEIHYRTTGHEIWEQTEGRITAFVAGVGTGGTISGVARYLKEQQPRHPHHRRRSGGLASCPAARPSRGRSKASARTSCPRRSTASSSMSGSASATPSRSTSPRPWPAAKGMLVGGSSGTNVAAALRTPAG